MNAIIETQVKQTFMKVTKGIYDELFKRPLDRKSLFG